MPYSAFIHECSSPFQEQGSEHLGWAGPARRHQLGNGAVSYGRVGDGLLLCVEGGEVNRKGEDTLSLVLLITRVKVKAVTWTAENKYLHCILSLVT